MKTPVSADLYDQEYYKKYNHGYDGFEKGGELMIELKSKFKDISFENKKVLDIGCGRIL